MIFAIFFMAIGCYAPLRAQYRETRIRIHNNTGFKLLGNGTERPFGKCNPCPPAVINKEFEIVGEGNINITEVEGTEGWFEYKIDDGKGSIIHFYWDNPLVGSNAYNVWASGPYETYFTGGYNNRTVVDLYINKAKPVFVPGFSKSSWLKFPNGWGNIPYSKPSGYFSAIPDWITDNYTNTNKGVCGGMVFTVLDYFYAKKKIPQMAVNPKDVNDPFFGYIIRRLFATFEGNNVTLAMKLNQPLYPDHNCNPTGTFGLADGKAHVIRAIE